jgi:hypothetical protein
MLNPDLNYVEIEMGSRTSPSGEELPPAFIAADEALVALELEMQVFNVEQEKHASRVARKEIGSRLSNIPLQVLRVERLPDEDGGEDGTGEDTVEASEDGEPARTDPAGNGDDADADADEDEDLIPEFEDLVEDT